MTTAADVLNESRHQLEEAMSELRRHHELIAWLRTELEWACETVLDEWTGTDGPIGDIGKRATDTLQRLNREVA